MKLKYHHMRAVILFIFSLLLCIPLSAQQTTYLLEGVVRDETGQTLPGANVLVKGTTNGTMTNSNGLFTINAKKNDVLVFSFVGYASVEHLVTGEQKDISIQLSPSTEQMEEVVVMGVGSKRRASQVSSISTVDVGQLQAPTTSVANLLGGKVAGVISMMSSGEPGKNIADFWVRGIGTFGYNSGALVLIDGLEGDINSIDPADIESFSVLKDASATAVYGVRGANGVVIITTKKGMSDKVSVVARANVSMSYLKRLPEYVGSYDYAKLVNEARTVRGESKMYEDVELDIIRLGLDPDMYPDVNWYDEMIKRTSWKQSYFLSARGGGDIARYYISVGGNSETAAYKIDPESPYAKNVGYNTYNYRLNLDLNITPTTVAYFGSSGFLKIHKQPGRADTDQIWNNARELNPLMLPAKYSTGEIPTGGTDAETRISPYTMVNYMGYRSNQEFKGQATLRLEQDLAFVTSGLKFSVQGSYDIISQFNERRTVIPYMYRADQRSSTGELILREMVRGGPAVYEFDKNQYRKYYLKSTVNWSRAFGDHRVSALFNYEMEDNKWANDADDANKGANANLRSIPKRYLSFAGWANYSYKDTYLLDINLGYTGTENFQPGKQFGWFPAVGLGWVPTNYVAVQNALPFLSYLKIRGTIGSVGNDRISNRRFPYLTIVSAGTNNPFGTTTSVYSINETITGADNLNWEQSVKTDVGFEMRMFKDKLEIIASFFRDKRTGIFQERHLIPQYAGLINNPYGNVGEMKSFGSDGTIKYEHDLTKNSTVTIRGNYTYSNNTVINWEEPYPRYSYQELTGLPNGYKRGFKSLGFFKDELDVLTSPVQNWGAVMPGDLKYQDVNGDGKINDDDRVPLSDNEFPLLMFGIGGEYRYKSFTVGIMFRGTGKSNYYIVEKYDDKYLEGMGYIPFRAREYGNILTTVNDPANRWVPKSYAEANGIDVALAENPNAEFPRLTYGDNANNRQLSDFWKRDGRYFRLQEITLNYNWRSDFLKKIKISSVDLQLIGTNLAVWGKSKIFDPEQARFNGSKYPLPAVYSLQIYINL